MYWTCCYLGLNFIIHACHDSAIHRPNCTFLLCDPSISQDIKATDENVGDCECPCFLTSLSIIARTDHHQDLWHPEDLAL